MLRSTTNILAQSFTYDVETDGSGDGSGNILTPIQIPAGAIFYNLTWYTNTTLDKDPMGADPFIGVGTINNVTLCTGNLTNYILFTGGTGFNAATPVAKMDNSLNIIVHVESGILIAGNVTVFLQYYFPI